ncbi:Arogenate dehydratase/prephenate dehydratase 2, chloroplastic [Galdieria sulphuraria]|nr:Arogenate dehydratase/prephenate dehydratase 2, chloroplastic [Galdieria sulphuraria]
MNHIYSSWKREPGSYSESAALEFFGRNVALLPCASFESAFDAVENGYADRAVIPIENSLAGTIHKNYDLLLQHEKLNIVDVKRVLSHPMALAQCNRYLEEHNFIREVTYDTAGSAKILREKNLRDAAAVASERAAELYALNILAADIEDEPENYTRFLVLSKQAYLPPSDSQSKTSIAFSLKNTAGALFKALSVFALRDIDLTKMESRHLYTLGDDKVPETLKSARRWKYLFYLDFAASLADESAKNALRHLSEIAPFIRVLGSYRRAVTS